MPYLFVTLGWTLALASFAGSLAAAYLGAASTFPEVRTSARLGAAVAIWLLAAAGWFLLSTALGGFSFTSTVVASACATVAIAVGTARHADVRSACARDLDRLVAIPSAVRGWPLVWAFAPLAITMAVRVARDLLCPPLATDALTYHLFRAARWVQTAQRTIEEAPDAWSYVAYYPPTGDGLHALALLPASTGVGDALLAAWHGFIWLALALGAYAAARTWTLDGRRAALVAGTIVSLPAVVAFAGSAYVDQLVLLAFVLAIATLPHGPRGLALGLACLGLAASIKATGLPIAGLGGLFALRFAVRGDRRHRLGFIIGVAVALGLVLPAYLPGWIDHQNPLYPFALDLGGLHLPGNLENEAVHRGAFAPPELTTFRWQSFLRALFWPKLDAGAPHLNFGPFVVPLLALGMYAVVRGLVRGELRLEAAWCLALVVVFGLRLSGADSLAHRTFFAPAVGRFLLVPVAALVLMAGQVARDDEAGSSRHTLDGGLAVALIGGALVGFPRGLGRVAAVPSFALAAGILAVAVGLWILGPRLAVAGARRSRLVVGLVAAAMVIASGPALCAAREHLRYPVWSAAVAGEAFDPHPTDARVMKAWPLWQALDDADAGVEHRVAFTAGWDGMGHNWYRYPLLGRRLQNDVVYVPITADGTAVDYRDPNAALARGSMAAWLQRLAVARVDRLVIGSPPRCPELLWAQARPDIFELVAREGDNLLFAVHLERLSVDETTPSRP